MTRLYWWYKGAPEDRAGGPWWYQDFQDMSHVTKILTPVKPLLHAYAITDGSEGDWSCLKDIRPPKDAEIIYPNGTINIRE